MYKLFDFGLLNGGKGLGILVVPFEFIFLCFVIFIFVCFFDYMPVCAWKPEEGFKSLGLDL